MPDTSKSIKNTGDQKSEPGDSSITNQGTLLKGQAVPTKQDIEDAHARIKPYIHHTPVLTSQGIDALIGGQLFFKCENLQKVGAFKARGAMNAVLSLSADDLVKGVATHSSGNHAQALWDPLESTCRHASLSIL